MKRLDELLFIAYDKVKELQDMGLSDGEVYHVISTMHLQSTCEMIRTYPLNRHKEEQIGKRKKDD